MKNAINRFEIPAKDPDRAVKFYSAILVAENHSRLILEPRHTSMAAMTWV